MEVYESVHMTTTNNANACLRRVFKIIAVGIYLLKGNNRNTRTRCETCSKLTIKIPERRQWRFFIVNFEHVIAGWDCISTEELSVKEMFSFLTSKLGYFQRIIWISAKWIYSFLQRWNPPPPLSGYPPLSETHPNGCMQTVRNTLK